MAYQSNQPDLAPRMFHATVARNDALCREHYHLVLAGANIAGARPGQFLHLAPVASFADWQAMSSGDAVADSLPPRLKPWATLLAPWGTLLAPWGTLLAPMLRRAFSIAGLRKLSDDACEMDIIYRVVGAATRWLESLQVGEAVSVMGPLGNMFPIHPTKPCAWLVAGGVGLPPMLWLGEALNAAGKRSVAFVGSRSAELLPLTIVEPNRIADDAREAAPVAKEFAENGIPVVISTDDGSMGFHGHTAGALSAFFESAAVAPDDVVVYACGPERMMEAVARFCIDKSIECYVCMERAMACGTGTCQSCVVTVRDASAADGWRYELCCSQGPVFDARRVIWS